MNMSIHKLTCEQAVHIYDTGSSEEKHALYVSTRSTCKEHIVEKAARLACHTRYDTLDYVLAATNLSSLVDSFTMEALKLPRTIELEDTFRDFYTNCNVWDSKLKPNIITKDMILHIASMPSKHRRDSSLVVLGYAIYKINKTVNIGDYTPFISDLTEYCTDNVIKAYLELPCEGLYAKYGILRDITSMSKELSNMGLPYEFPVIKSLGQIKRVHDDLVVRLNAAKDKNRSISYTEAFENAVKQMGWYLPKTTKELADRGRDHHNCVKTYIGRHCDNDKYEVTRLIMSEESTCELYIAPEEIDPKHLVIEIRQCKGKYNEDYPEPDISPLYHLSYSDYTVTVKDL